MKDYIRVYNELDYSFYFYIFVFMYVVLIRVFCLYLHNSSGRTMAQGSTQPLTEMSTRCISWA